MSEDPIHDGLNWYTYASNNPIMYIDPFGLYDRQKAVDYVLTWYNSHNPNYLAMDTMLTNIGYKYEYGVFLGMADCTNFTSQALFAGDIKMNEAWHYYMIENKISWGWTTFDFFFGLMQTMYVDSEGKPTPHVVDYDFTGPWALANEQYKYFSNPDNGYISGNVISISPGSKTDISNAIKNGVQIGNLLYWSWEDDGFINHSTMITNIENGQIKYGGHTNSAKDKDLYDILNTYPNAKAYIVKIRDDA